MKQFKDLNVGSFFKLGRYVYIKIEDQHYDSGGVAFNAVVLSRSHPGNLAHFTPEDVVKYLPNMKH